MEEHLKYLTTFQGLQYNHHELFDLYGDCLLIEEVKPQEMKSKGGVIMPNGAPSRNIDGFETNRPCFVRVLLVGEGYYDKDGDTVPLTCQSGDIVLVGKLSVKWLSTFGTLVSTPDHQLGIAREGDVQMRFKGQGAFDKAFAYVNEKISERA